MAKDSKKAGKERQVWQKVMSRKQAIAIGLSKTGKKGAKVPKKKSSRKKS